MKTISYSKERTLRTSVTNLKLEGISVLESVPVSFFQKFIILFLQNGLKASTKDDLIDQLSDLLNFNRKCVENFVEYLNVKGLLTYDMQSGKFLLDSSLLVPDDYDVETDMRAGLDTKAADCDKLLFLKDAITFLLDTDLPQTHFKRVPGSERRLNLAETSDVKLAVLGHDSRIRELIERAFENTNIHVQPGYTYQLILSGLSEYQIDFPALFQYEYSTETRESQRTKTIVQGSSIPEKLIEQLSAQFDKDDKIPRFISLDENFYKKLPELNEQITTNDIAILDEKKEKEKALEAFNEQNRELEKKRKEFKEAQANADAKYRDIQKEKQETEDSIQASEDLISSNSSDDMLVKGLQEQIKLLKAQRDSLETKLQENEQQQDEQRKDFEAREEELSRQIELQRDAISEFDGKIKEGEQQRAELQKQYFALLNQNQSKLNPTVQRVLARYPAKENILFRNISSMCADIDKAISAAESEAYDDLVLEMDRMRETYRKTMHVVFEVLLGKNVEKLASFLHNGFARMELKQVLGPRNIKSGTIDAMKEFFSLSNAVGHLNEKGIRLTENIEEFNSFKSSTRKEREEILLSVPQFFDSITLSKKELAEMCKRLSL